MNTRILMLLLCCAILAGPAQALEITNVRVTCGLLGPKRAQNEFLPGDVVFLSFDIQGVKVDAKTGMAEYQSTMEIFDGAGKAIFSQAATPRKLLLLGGSRIPSYGYALILPDQEAGKYKIKITITDLLAKSSKSLEYEFTLKRKDFGIVQPAAPATALVGQDYPLSFGLVGMKRDAKKLPDVDLVIQFMDERRQKVFPEPKKVNIKDLHDPAVSDLSTLEVIPIGIPFFLNRPGNFTVEIQAIDNLARETRTLTLPLRVIEPNNE